MSSIIHANLDNISLFVPCDIKLSKLNRKRWCSAFRAIYCSRAFKDVLTSSEAKIPLLPCKAETKLLPPPSDEFVIDVAEDFSSFYGVDQTTLTKLVKGKDLEKLEEFQGVQGIATSLKSNVNDGINGSDTEDISRRTEAYGSNTYHKPPRKIFFHFVWEAFKDPTIAILLACATLSLGFGIKKHGPKEGWYDGGSIFVAVFLVISLSAISNFRQSRQFAKLSKVSNNNQIEVVRNGRRQQISIFGIVVGDVVCLKIGDQVPADGLFLGGHSLSIDESSMTGESDHVEVNHNQNPFLISGTKVADGYGQMLVTSVGMNTAWGEMMSSVSRDINEKTPLQERLDKLTSAIGKVGLAVAFLVLVVLLVRYFTGNTKYETEKIEFIRGKTKVDDVINSVVEIIAAAVTIIVVAIPEGLPLAVTLTMAYSMNRMMADNAMVRKLSACETMGSATTICTDKTGTLTQNQMTVTKFWLGKELIEATNYTFIDPSILKLLHQAVSLNTTGSIFRTANAKSKDLEFSGSPTEKAILSWAVLELTMDMEKVKQSCTILHVEAFNSKKKRSGVLTEKNIDNTIHVHWKGAAEMILAMCSYYYNLDGELIALDDNEKKHFNHIIQGMAASSLRCIAFAHKQITDANCNEGNIKQQLPENGLNLLGIVGIKDPCRPGVKKAVEDCQKAGVNIKMITGDNIFTATAIATECGILRSNHEVNDGSVIEGLEFRNYTDEERMEKVDKIVVMARSSPFDKDLMVKCLKRKGHVVAVTGDGTNDAPALKEADIGLSMGIQGTEVAKESSDIIILDDNFTSVATVLRWGRCVYNNIQKFIQFQLTVNVAALVINFVAAVSAGEVPLTAVQLLWVNLIMDTLGALALATERPTEELMEKRPVGRTEPLITNIMWRNLLAQAFYQIIVLLTLQFKGESIFHVNRRVNDTLIFNTFVLCQVFNEFNARKLEKKNIFEGVHRNKLFMGIIGITIILQVAMVEFLKRFANTERLDWGQWGACIGIAAASWPIGWLIKCIPVPEKTFLSRSTTPSDAVIHVPAEEQDWLRNLVRSQSMEHFHQVAGNVEWLASFLQTDTENGINDDDQKSIASRRQRYGSNKIETNKAPNTKQIAWETIKDPIIVILLLCALLSLGFGVIKHGYKGWSDGGGIIVAVFVVVAVNAYCKIWSRRKIFSKLATAGDCFTVDVTRNGKRQRISVFDVVVGDIVSLTIGDRVPADGLYIEGHSFQVEESAIMKSLKFKDRHPDPFLLTGSKVVDGYARMLVTAVGMNAAAQWHCEMFMSENGYDANQKTPLERKMDKLAMRIATVGFVVAFLVLLILLIRYFTGNMQGDDLRKNETSTIRHVFFAVIGILVTPIAIASTAIPDGLLLAVIVPLAYSMNEMAAEKKVLVRKLAALEEIGSTTVICTNGKGNLISQNLQVTRFWDDQDTFSSIAPNVRKLLLQGVDSDNTEVSPGSSTESVELAIRNWAYQPAIEDNIEQFSANATVLHQRGDPEAMLANCYQYYDRHGNIKEITNEVREILKQKILEMKSKFPQCIGFSCSEKNGDDQEEECFTLIGVAGLAYPCLPEIKDVVNDFRSAGVDVKLATRSELPAAIAIAHECGILLSNEEPATDLVIDGHHFRNYPEEDRLRISNKIRVLARASTLDRRCLVQDLKKIGHGVAVTGDSVGDAAVLKEANVGLSLGIQGTNIAKENSDFIILKDNFEPIATAMRWGRSMHCKIQTYAQFQLTVSVSSLGVDFVIAIFAREPPNINAVASISAGKIPFAALQVLWAKLIVGLLAALAITKEKPAKKLQDLPPVKKTGPFVTNIMWKNIVGQALYPIIILLTINFKGESVLKVDTKVRDTMIFNTFVLWQLVSIFKTKKFEGKNVIKWIQREKLFWTILISIGCLQGVIVEALGRFAGTKRLNWMEWAECIGLAVPAWPIGWLVQRCISLAP